MKTSRKKNDDKMKRYEILVPSPTNRTQWTRETDRKTSTKQKEKKEKMKWVKKKNQTISLTNVVRCISNSRFYSLSRASSSLHSQSWR